MFEQTFYTSADAPDTSQEGDLFHNYEIKGWTVSSRLYKILAVSVLINVSFLGVVFGADLLTRRSCDSPFIGRVCQVLDMAYVGTLILGSDRAYVDEAYEKIDLSDAEITMISRDGDNAQLQYPDGYFQLANPEKYAAVSAQNDPLADYPGSATDVGAIPGVPSLATPPNSMLNTPLVLPKKNPNAVTGSIPDSPFAINDGEASESGKTKKGRGGKVSTSNTNSTVAEKSPEPTPNPGPTPLASDAVTALQVNKKPLTDFADSVVSQRAANQIDLNQQFTVVLDGFLTTDGMLDPKKSKFDPSKEKGDPKMVELARQALEAVGQSGFFSYLRTLGVDKVSIQVSQDDKQISAVIISSQKSPERARSISSGANGYITIGRAAAKDPSDELTLLQGASVTANGSNFVLNFAVPKAVAQEMIDRKLKEAESKRTQQPQPNGNAGVKSNENAAKK